MKAAIDEGWEGKRIREELSRYIWDTEPPEKINVFESFPADPLMIDPDGRPLFRQRRIGFLP